MEALGDQKLSGANCFQKSMEELVPLCQTLFRVRIWDLTSGGDWRVVLLPLCLEHRKYEELKSTAKFGE